MYYFQIPELNNNKKRSKMYGVKGKGGGGGELQPKEDCLETCELKRLARL